MVRIGVFGGSFDPVHVGHLVAAECCREQAALDRVLFVPTAIQPHKRDRQAAAGHHRLEMLALATGGNAAFAVHADEVERGGVSFTVDTLERLAVRHPADELFLLLGPDVAATLPTWRNPGRIVALTELVLMERQGSDDLGGPDSRSALEPLLGRERFERVLAARVRLPAIGIRASDLREAVAAGRSIRYRTPRAVECYLAAHGLYRGPARPE